MSGNLLGMRSTRRNDAAAAVGEQIGQRRQHLRLSQAELANVTGLSQQYISEIERGLKLPEIDTLDLLSKALGLPAYPLRVAAGYSGTDGGQADPEEAELVNLYRSLSQAERVRMVRIVRELARPAA